MEEAFSCLARYRAEDGSFAAWLFGIARNRLRMYLRLMKQQDSSHLTEIESIDCGMNPRDLLDAIANQDEVQTVLGAMPASLVDALLLYALVGFKSREVAQILRISESAAQQRIWRGRKDFRIRYDALRARSCGDTLQLDHSEMVTPSIGGSLERSSRCEPM